MKLREYVEQHRQVLQEQPGTTLREKFHQTSKEEKKWYSSLYYNAHKFGVGEQALLSEISRLVVGDQQANLRGDVTNRDGVFYFRLRSAADDLMGPARKLREQAEEDRRVVSTAWKSDPFDEYESARAANEERKRAAKEEQKRMPTLSSLPVVRQFATWLREPCKVARRSSSCAP